LLEESPKARRQKMPRKSTVKKSEEYSESTINLLKESEKRYKRVFDTASDGIVFFEQHEGKITHANPATEKMLGYTQKEIIGRQKPSPGNISIQRSIS
jgi:PAS domain-containing protein